MARRAKATPKVRAAPPGTRDPGAAIAAGALALVCIASWFAVDTGAEASFDAPKRLLALVGIALSGAAAFFSRADTAEADAPLSRERRTVLVLFLLALAGAAVSALVSPRRAAALDSLRVLLLFALLLPLGASRIFPRRGGLLGGLFVACAAASGLVSVLQARGSFQPFRLITAGHREATTAFVGAVGLLAAALVLAGLVALGGLLVAGRTSVRVLSAAALAAIAAGLAANQNLTAITALGAGSAALLVCLLRRKAITPLLALAAIAVLAFVAYAPLRSRAREAISAVAAGDWDRLTTHRLAPWNAAIEMARQRPLTGVGPGNFMAEFVPSRLAAELRAHRRFFNPLLTSSYGEAHSEYLQAFSDVGIPAGLAAIAAFFLTLWGTGRRAFGAGRADPEAAILFALLVAGATAALTWFPLQRPVTAVPLLLAAGRAWRRLP